VSVAGVASGSSRNGETNDSLQLLNGQLGVIESVAHCVEQNWPVLLAGGNGTGWPPQPINAVILSEEMLTNSRIRRPIGVVWCF
jgi:hypothetical protein